MFKRTSCDYIMDKTWLLFFLYCTHITEIIIPRTNLTYLKYELKIQAIYFEWINELNCFI